MVLLALMLVVSLRYRSVASSERQTHTQTDKPSTITLALHALRDSIATTSERGYNTQGQTLSESATGSHLLNVLAAAADTSTGRLTYVTFIFDEVHNYKILFHTKVHGQLFMILFFLSSGYNSSHSSTNSSSYKTSSNWYN